MTIHDHLSRDERWTARERGADDFERRRDFIERHREPEEQELKDMEDDERRDDTNLRFLICPHCKTTLPVLQLRLFEKQQLLYMKCNECGEGITKDQIDNTYREYR